MTRATTATTGPCVRRASQEQGTDDEVVGHREPRARHTPAADPLAQGSAGADDDREETDEMEHRELVSSAQLAGSQTSSARLGACKDA